MTHNIRSPGTKYPISLSRHTSLVSTFLRRHPIPALHLAAISASLLSVSHPQMVYLDFQVWPPSWNTSGR